METALDDVRRHYLSAESARHELEAAIVRARRKGATWAEIGAAMDVSRQAAAQRYGKPKGKKS